MTIWLKGQMDGNDKYDKGLLPLSSENIGHKKNIIFRRLIHTNFTFLQKKCLITEEAAWMPNMTRWTNRQFLARPFIHMGSFIEVQKTSRWGEIFFWGGRTDFPKIGLRKAEVFYYLIVINALSGGVICKN